MRMVYKCNDEYIRKSLNLQYSLHNLYNDYHFWLRVVMSDLATVRI